MGLFKQETLFVKNNPSCKFCDLPMDYFFKYKNMMFCKVGGEKDECNVVKANFEAFKPFSRFHFPADIIVNPTINKIIVTYEEYK